MTFAAKIADVWSVLPVGQPVTLNEISVSWETLNTMSVRSREEFGAYEVPEPDPAPEGKVEVSRALKPTGERPEWEVDYVDMPPPGPEPVPETISDRQFAQALAKQGVITQDEALAFVKRGEVPDMLQAAIDAVDDADERFDLDMAVSGATLFDRSNPSTIALAEALEWSPAQMDDLWRFAATIR